MGWSKLKLCHKTGSVLHGWRAVMDETCGKTYYWHAVTNQTTWKPPAGADRVLLETQSAMVIQASFWARVRVAIRV